MEVARCPGSDIFLFISRCIAAVVEIPAVVLKVSPVLAGQKVIE